jgi:purine-binding chemotaxis protein CheW
MDIVKLSSLSAASAPGSWGLLRAGAALLALRVEALQEVIACPPRLDVLPSSAPGLCGAVRLRGLVIPVLDLCSVLGLAPVAGHGEAAGVIVLMRHADRLLGLRADAVQGMARIDASALQALQQGDGSEGGIATHAFEVGDEVATVLDAARIAALPRVPMVAVQTAATAAALATAHAEPLLLFRCAAVPLAVAATAVGATVPEVELRDSPLRRGLCLGVFEHHGLELPVVDLAAWLGLSSGPRDMSQGSRSALLVLRTPQGQVGLTMDGVSDIVRVAEQAILPVPALGLAKPALVRGLLEQGTPGSQAQPHLLLDHEAMAADELLAALSTLARRAGAAGVVTTAAATSATAAKVGTDAAADSARGRTVVTYHAGVETASPLIQVSEIIPLPASLVPTGAAGGSTLGVFTHRGSAVPLVDLVTLLSGGRGQRARAAADAQRVLIVEDEGRRIGFMVDGLGTIETARWEGPDAQAPGEGFDAAQFARRPPLLELGTADTRRTLARLDLQHLARAISPPP